MKKVKRLYSEFKPERYELYLEPDRENKLFSGKVAIIGKKTGRPSRRITLHQKGLKINKAVAVKLEKGGKQTIELDRINTLNGVNELRLHAKDVLYPGKYRLEIEFSGKITEPMHGLYPCNFEIDGQKKQLIATQFESHHAREVFPCVDEPEAKAVFSLSLKTPSGETVIANTPPISEKKVVNSKITVFEDTPIMSSYLLAFVYGELGFAEAKTKSGITVRVYSTPDKVDLTAFALDVSVRSLEFFEDYFGVPYPLPKLDVIGLPDFSSGAMENWGLITFREQVLYVDPESTGVETKEFVAMVVAHEVAHMWFGNLVTMKWWNDLWLNESFANLMEYRAVDELFPEWKVWEEFTAREMGQALVRDALPTVQAVRTQVNHPDELSSLFDPSIVYAKGGCLLNMVRHLVGEDAFRKGLKSYFKEFEYSNTEADDLWNHLEKASGFKIGEIMHTWLSQPGFPLLGIDYQPGAKSLSVSQERLVIGKNDKPAKTKWEVPLAASAKLDEPILIKTRQDFEVRRSGDYPLVFNHDAHSYFAARYQNHEHFDEILNAARNLTLSPIDRLLLVQSYVLMERAGKIETKDNLKLLEALSNEREESVWSMLAGIIGGVRVLIGKDPSLNNKLDIYIRPLLKPLVKELGWSRGKNDSTQTQKLRALALGMSAAAEDDEVIKHGLGLFAKFKKPSDLQSDVRPTVYLIAVRHGKKADFDRLLKLYVSLTNAEEKEEIAAQLTSSRDPARIKQLLGMLSGPEVRTQDMPTWFGWLMRNRYSVDAAWKWLTDNWLLIEEKYGSDKSYDRFTRYSAMVMSYPGQLKDFRDFFESKSNIALERSIKLGIEEIDGRIAWRQKNEKAVSDWLKRLP